MVIIASVITPALATAQHDESVLRATQACHPQRAHCTRAPIAHPPINQ